MTNIDFISILSQYKEQLYPVIKQYVDDITHLPKYCSIPQKYTDIIDFHHQMVSDYPSRKGKYLRPSLVFLTAQSMGGSVKSATLPAAAMQVSEEWILIHDDFEDNSLERRGQPALHRIFGSELAVNAGDSLQVVMWRIILDIGRPDISDEFYRLLVRTTLGQTIDIKWTQNNILDLTDEDVLLILESKTGYYTIAGPMRLGAITANANEQQLDLIYQFGKQLGYAFQITDDILDLTSDFSGLKKQQFNDIYEGKRTIMLAHLWRSASSTDRKSIYRIMQKTRSHKTAPDVATIIRLMEKYQSIQYARQLAISFATSAKKIFDTKMDFIKVEPYRSQIKLAIDFIINRDH